MIVHYIYAKVYVSSESIDVHEQLCANKKTPLKVLIVLHIFAKSVHVFFMKFCKKMTSLSPLLAVRWNFSVRAQLCQYYLYVKNCP